MNAPIATAPRDRVIIVSAGGTDARVVWHATPDHPKEPGFWRYDIPDHVEQIDFTPRARRELVGRPV